MDATMQPPPYSLEDRKTATFAEVANSTGNNPGFMDVLGSFREFLNRQESVKLSQNQLGLFRGLSVLVLEASINSIKSGGDVSEILSNSARILDMVSSSLITKTEINVVIEDPSKLNDLESNIREGFDGLEAQLRKLLQASELESTMHREELLKAQQRDRAKIEELEAIIRQAPQSGGSLDAIIQKSMEDNLKIIGDHTVGQKQVEARRALGILTGLTGKSLPPSTLLGRDFVTIGPHAIHQGTSYDVFLGEYFTGEKIAIKVLRHCVDEEKAKKTHERLARQALNWSSLRHDAILPFYGIGVTESPVVCGEFQPYMVSPYLQNQDVKRYLRKYSRTPKRSRLQMVLDVARGLYRMHETAELPGPSNGIVHGALNIYNVLIRDSGRAAISGFGHSKVIRDLQESFTGDNAEYSYMAPEMMMDDPHVTHGTDIWSWAMTTLEILTDVPAFGERTKGPGIITLLTMLKRPKRADHPKIEEYSDADGLWNIFEECWDQDSAARPSADALVKRLKPILKQELGKKTRGGTQEPYIQPYEMGSTVTEAGRRDAQRLEFIREQLDKRIRGREKQPIAMAYGDPPAYQGYQGIAQLELGKADPPGVLSPPSPPSPPSSPPQLSSEPKVVMVSSHMSVAEMVKCLIDHGCKDVTTGLDLPSCTQVPIAGGGYGDIYRGSLQDGRAVAIKCPRIFIGSDDDNDGLRKVMKRAAHEMYAASKLSHPHIVRVIGVACFREGLAIILPWMEKRSVMSYLAGTPDADRCRLCTEVSSGLSYMHQNKIVHGDLKGMNVLVSETGAAHITDFGNTILKQYTLKFTRTLSTPGFSLSWAPLEVLKEETGLSREADVYSLGMTILEILTGNAPFHGKREHAIYDAICQQKLPDQPQDSIPSDSLDGDKLWHLIQRCWAKEPTERPAATEVVEIMGTFAQKRLTRGQPPVVLGEENGDLPSHRPGSPINRAGAANPISNHQTIQEVLQGMYRAGIIE